MSKKTADSKTPPADKNKKATAPSPAPEKKKITRKRKNAGKGHPMGKVPGGPGRGRPTAMTDDVVSKILAFIRGGNYIETAAAACGINKDTMHTWMRDGARQKSGPLKDFSDAVAKAVAESEALDVNVINKAANTGDWRAAAWRLERKTSRRWGRQDRLQIEKVNFDDMTDAELEEMALTGELPKRLVK